MDHYRQNTNNDLQLDAPLEAITRQIQDLFKADSFREVRHALRKMTGQEDSREMAEQPASHKKAFEHWKQQRLDRRSDPNDPSKVVYEIPVHGISNRNAKSPYYYEQLERVSVPQDFDPLTTAAEDIQVSPLGRQKRISKATFDREVGRDAKSAQRINMYTHGVFTSAEGANDVASQLAISGGPVVAIDWGSRERTRTPLLDYEKEVVSADESINPGKRNLAPLMDNMVQSLHDKAHIKSTQVDMTGFSHGCDITAQYLLHRHHKYPRQPLGNVVLAAPDVSAQYVETNQADIFGAISGKLFVFQNRGRMSSIADQAVKLAAPISDKLLSNHHRMHENQQPLPFDPLGLNGLFTENDQLYHTRQKETDSLGPRLGATSPADLHIRGKNRDKIVFVEDSALSAKQAHRTRATGHYIPAGEVGATLLNNGLPRSKVTFDPGLGEYVFNFIDRALAFAR